MPSPTTPILDSAVRANGLETTGGFPWVGDTIGAGGAIMSILSNGFSCQIQPYCESYWNGATFGPDSEVYITADVLPGSGGSFGFQIRTQSPGSAAADGYRISVSGTEIQIVEVFNGGESVLGSPISHTWTTGQYLFQCFNDTLYVSKDGSLLGQRNDATYSLAGNIGKWMYDPGGGNGRLSGFGGGTVQLVAPAIDPHDYSRFPKYKLRRA